MDKHKIVPDVVKVAPSKLLQITYPSGAIVNSGNELKPAYVNQVPFIQWEAQSTDLHTLIFTDPDAPSRDDPKFREFKHWLVVNIPGNYVPGGDTLTEFVGSAPGADSGIHRYCFFIYKQSGPIDVTKECKVTNKNRELRRYFSAQKFADKYNLGNPIAGNFYLAQYDDFCPTIHKQFT